MKYLVAIHHPVDYDASAEDEAMHREISALNVEMAAKGARFFAGGLESPSKAKSLRANPGGKVLVTDGPYIETKELIGGFWILEAANMDEALEWGRKAVIACRAPVEVRQFIFRGVLTAQLDGGIMQEELIREILEAHWQESAAGNADAEHDIYDDDVICDYPQSGERIQGRNNLQALRSHHPDKRSGFNVRRMLGSGDVWITEYTICYQRQEAYTVSIMEFRGGKVVHETQYFADPFEAPAWRSQWVQQKT